MDLSSARSIVSLMNSVLAPTSAVGGNTASGEAGKPSVDFGSVLKSSPDRASASQQKARSISRSFEMGDNDVDLHDVILSLQKVSIDMQTAVQVRNKLVSTYQSIIGMSIWHHAVPHFPCGGEGSPDLLAICIVFDIAMSSILDQSPGQHVADRASQWEDPTIKTLYQTQATAGDGRADHTRSASGMLNLPLSLPCELGSAGGAATNPEQLFATGYATCFENAILHVARDKQIKLASTSVTATVGTSPREDGGFALTVSLSAALGGVDQATAETLVATTHDVCPCPHAVRDNIDVQLNTVTR